MTGSVSCGPFFVNLLKIRIGEVANNASFKDFESARALALNKFAISFAEPVLADLF